MIDHFGIRIAADKWDATVAFYTAALAPLGYKITASYMDGGVIGMGAGHPDLWLTKVDAAANPGSGTHFAFRAESTELVQAFHAAGLQAGGTCNGPAGPRPMYGPTYYGAFVHDPAGNNVEVVTHTSA